MAKVILERLIGGKKSQSFTVVLTIIVKFPNYHHLEHKYSGCTGFQTLFGEFYLQSWQGYTQTNCLVPFSLTWSKWKKYLG